MTKKVAVTGHTSGLGKSFYETFSSLGYSVEGFSRSNGFDLRDYSIVSKMLEIVSNYDIFINNAKPDYAQSQILYRLVRNEFKGKIVSIGSMVVDHPPNWEDTFLLEYCSQKVALAHANSVLLPIASATLILDHPSHLTDTNEYVLNLIKIHKL